jgi:hypothetical protein
MCGEENHRQVRRRLRLAAADLAQQMKPVARAHVDVADQDVDRQRGEHLRRIVAVGHPVDVLGFRAAFLEEMKEKVEDQPLIIGDQHLQL